MYPAYPSCRPTVRAPKKAELAEGDEDVVGAAVRTV